MRHKPSLKRPLFVPEPVPLRIPDRRRGFFGADRTRNKLKPIGRPNDIFGDVIVNVSRVRAMEGA